MTIQKVAVIGAGVMGAGIAAQLANAGFEVELLDRVDEKRFPNDRDGVAKGAIDALLKNKPAAFMHKRNAKKLRPGNTTDHLDRLKDADLIIEAVFEDPKVKFDIFQKIDQHRKPGSIVASNTSTIPLKNLVEGQSDAFKKNFVITHFFNPPRYMPLLELITSADNDPAVVAALTRFMEEKAGKTVVRTNDTPGFIANRIGTFWIQAAINGAHDYGLTVEEADALINKPMGVPKTGIFGLVDLVGLDLMPKISASLLSKLPADDGYAQIHREYPVISKMIEDGYTGRKGKGGFYRLGPNKEKIAVDLKTGAERPQVKKPKLPALDAAAKGGLKGLINSKDKGGEYAWSVLSQTLVYAAEHAHTVADDIFSVDQGMKLGYNWKYGPFELLDKVGVDYVIKRLQAEGRPVPALIQQAAGKTFYRTENGKLQYMTKDGSYTNVVRAEGVLLLSDIKRAQKPLYSVKKKLIIPGGKPVDMGAHIWDIGDGVLCVEFDSTMNMLDFTSMKVLNRACDMIEGSQGKYKALVIHNEGDNFSTGANLPLAVIALKLKQYWLVDRLVRMGQDTMKRLKYANFPVVSAPSGMALGGGCEVLMHSDHVQAHAETYPGLVEVGVGLLPAWGGTTELVTRAKQNKKLPQGPMPAVAMTFETISTAKVGTSADEAKDILILRASDGITMNKQRLLADAKKKAVELAADYKPPAPVNLELPGASGEAALNLAVDGFHLKGAVTGYDVVVSNKVAKVITGGDQAGPGMIVTQDYLRELERRHFMELVRDGRTVNRIVKTLPPNKGRKQYEAEERKDDAKKPQTPHRLRADADGETGFFAKIFGGDKACKKSFGRACNNNRATAPERDPKAKVNWPRFGK